MVVRATTCRLLWKDCGDRLSTKILVILLIKHEFSSGLAATVGWHGSCVAQVVDSLQFEFQSNESSTCDIEEVI